MQPKEKKKKEGQKEYPSLLLCSLAMKENRQLGKSQGIQTVQGDLFTN